MKKKEQDNNKHIIYWDTAMLAIMEINVTFVPDQLCLLEDPRCEIRVILEAYRADWQAGDSPATHERLSFISNKAARRQRGQRGKRSMSMIFFFIICFPSLTGIKARLRIITQTIN